MFRSFGEYDLLESLRAQEPMSSYYLAASGDPGRLVELRVLNPRLSRLGADPQTVEPRLEELRRVAHPYMVRVAYAGVRDDVAFYVTDHKESLSLAEHLAQQKGGRLDPGTALDLLLPVGEALAHLHQAGFVHGSFTAESIRIELASERTYLGTVDLTGALGLQRPPVPFKELSGLRPGSPEELAGKPPTPRTDVFLYAALLHQAITGRAPTSLAEAAGRPPAEAFAFGPPSMAAPLPPEVDQLLLKALAGKSDARPGSVRELLDGLAPLRQAIDELRTQKRGRGQSIRADGIERRKADKDRRKKKRRSKDKDAAELGFFDRLGAWFFEQNPVVVLVAFGLVFYGSAQVPLLISDPPAFMRAEYASNRLAVASKQFDRKQIQENLMTAAEEALGVPTAPENYEARMRTLRAFSKAIHKDDREKILGRKEWAELRIAYAKDKKAGCKKLDELLQRAYAHLKANEARAEAEAGS